MTLDIKTEVALRSLSADSQEYGKLNNKYKIAQIQASEAIDCKLLNFVILNNKNIEVGSINENFDDGAEQDHGFYKSRGSANYFQVNFKTENLYEDDYEYIQYDTLQEALDFIHKII